VKVTNSRKSKKDGIIKRTRACHSPEHSVSFIFTTIEIEEGYYFELKEQFNAMKKLKNILSESGGIEND
jgi:transcriptional regulator NrdR family protein